MSKQLGVLAVRAAQGWLVCLVGYTNDCEIGQASGEGTKAVGFCPHGAANDWVKGEVFVGGA
jgi:hypothetical protein